MQFDKLVTAKVATPFFVYDMDVIRAKTASIQNYLSKDIKLYYAIKANPFPQLVGRLSILADGADVSSSGEIICAVENGFRAEVLSFVGPGKTDEELHFAIKNGIGIISAESLNELRRVNVIAAKLDKKVNIVLRINPAMVLRSFSMKMGGAPSVFGVDEEESINVAKEIMKMPHCVFKGIHVYAGTQCLEEKAILENVQNTLKIAQTIMDATGVKFEIINFGGGFGVSYYEGQKDLDVPAISSQLTELFLTFKTKNACPQMCGILEIGRYIVAEAGMYVAKVIDVKTSRGKKFCVLDGGMNHLSIAAGQMGQVIRRNLKISHLSKPDSSLAEKVTITGPLCTSIDILGTDIDLPQVEVGDLLAIHNAGAYGLTASPAGFLSHVRPQELLWENGNLQLFDKDPQYTTQRY